MRQTNPPYSPPVAELPLVKWPGARCLFYGLHWYWSIGVNAFEECMDVQTTVSFPNLSTNPATMLRHFKIGPTRACLGLQVPDKQKREKGNTAIKTVAPSRTSDIPTPSLRYQPSKDSTFIKRPTWLQVNPVLPPELAAIGCVYFVQGISELATLAQTYYLKDDLHASPSEVAFYLSLANIPWMIKPVFGFLSDTVPLFGYKRRSYLLLCSAAGALSWFLLSVAVNSKSGMLAMLLLGSFASAFSDVIVDSMVVERTRSEAQESLGSLQSLCWASYAVGQMATAYLSGSLLQLQGARFIFGVTATFPLLAGLSSFAVSEEHSDTHHKFHGLEPGAWGRFQQTVASHTHELKHAFTQKDVLGPLAFLLLLSATPTADTAMFYYQTNELGFTPEFLGTMQLAAAVASLAGVLLYNSFLKEIPLRQLMLLGTMLAAGLQSSQLALVLGLHTGWGLDDQLFVLGGSVMLNVIQNVLSMPTMVLAARLCPKGMEATFFATLMSLINMADGIRQATGAGLMGAMGITSNEFMHLPELLLVCNASLLLPLPFLGLIPAHYDNETTPQGSNSSSAVGESPLSPSVHKVTSLLDTAAACHDGQLGALADVAPQSALLQPVAAPVPVTIQAANSIVPAAGLLDQHINQ